MKVLIADDEVKVCKLICCLVDWEALGFEVTGVVNDGRAAYDTICSRHPDVVITDIRMPGYDGLELVRRSKEQFPDIYFVIISGYSHFEYAQQAIKYGVEDYLLKPLKKKELEATLEKIREHYESRRSEAEKQESLRTLADHSRKELRQKFLTDLAGNALSCDYEYQGGIQGALEAYGCRFQEGEFAVYIIKPYTGENGLQAREIEFLLSKIRQVMQEQLAGLCYEFLTAVQDRAVLMLLNSEKDIGEEAERALKKLHIIVSNLFERQSPVCLKAARGGSVKLEAVAGSCREAAKALRGRMGSPGRLLLTVQDGWDSGKKVSDFIDMNLRNDILACQERMDVKAVAGMLDGIYGSLRPFTRDGELLEGCFCELAETLLFGMKNYGGDFDAGKLTGYRVRCSEACTFEELFEWLKNAVQEAYAGYEEKRRVTESRPIREAKQYIYEHFHENLNLEKVSEIIGFNPAYFSTLFKKETGMNFSEYLTGLRIQKAKTYLIQSDYEIADVAALVGYGDIKYFSRLFKKTTGVNPSEFRKLYS